MIRRSTIVKTLAASLVTASLATIAPAQVVDLSQLGTTYPGFRIDGIDASDFSGISVSGAGDVNGDGLADLVVGAYGADPGGKSIAGETYVVFGKTDGTVVDLENLGTGGFRIDGIDVGDYSGRSVSGAGDVNGDGLADLIVGAERGDPGGDSSAGESYVVFGKSDNTPVDLENLGTGGFRIDGIDPDDYSGRSVSGAGDVNGDGLADLIVGAERGDPGGDSSAGESYVVFGKSDNTPVDLENLGTGGFRIDGIDAYDFSGSSVSGAGDVNGDGLADLIVGAYNASPGGYASGESYVVFGKTDGTVVDLANLGTGGFRIDGIDAYDYSGFSVSGAGDVNGDGLADLIVGADQADPGVASNAGESYVVFGKSDNSVVDLANLGAGGFRIDGIDPNDFSGHSVSGAGDVNGDGLADLIVGAYEADPGGVNDAGESYVVFGKTGSTAVDLSLLDGTNGFRIDGIDASDRSRSVSGAGDVNGDGLADLIVGAYRGDPGENNSAGESYVIFGPGPGVTPGVAGETPGTVLSPSSVILAGDAAPIVIGQGDGTQALPARTIVDFADGDLARVTASLDKTTPLPAPFTAGVDAAPAIWEVSTARTFTSAQVTFQYTDAEIAGLDENNLQLLKSENPGGPFLPIPATVNPDTNMITGTVSSFSYFIIGSVQPLAVKLTAFEAEQTFNGVTISWSTASELNTAGFYLFESDAEGETLRAVTTSLIVGEGSEAGGADYRVFDPQPLAGEEPRYYLLMELENDGDEIPYGPTSVTPSRQTTTVQDWTIFE